MSLARATLVAASLFFVCLSTLSIARAQDDAPAGRDAEARALFDAGRVAYDEGRLENALEHFRRAYELSPRVALLLNIARTAEQLRQDQLAVESYEQYLREAPPDSPHRARAQNRLDALRELMARSEPERGAEAPPPADDIETTSAPAEAVDTGPGPAPWIVFGVSAAVTAVGVILVGVAVGDVAAVDNAPEGSDFDAVRGAHERSEPLSIAGFTLLGVGVAAMAGSLGWALAGGGEAADGESSVALSVGPGGVSLRGRF